MIISYVEVIYSNKTGFFFFSEVKYSWEISLGFMDIDYACDVIDYIENNMDKNHTNKGSLVCQLFERYNAKFGMVHHIIVPIDKFGKKNVRNRRI